MKLSNDFLSREEVIAEISCPVCGVEKGEPCIQSLSTRKRSSKAPIPNHKERTQAARSQAIARRKARGTSTPAD